MTFDEFHAALRMLMNIDLDELQAVGLMLDAPDRDPGVDRWYRFRDNPHKEFIRMSTGEAHKIWKIMEARRISWEAERAARKEREAGDQI